MADMPQVSARIPQDFLDFIDKQVELGLYHSRSDYIYRKVYDDMRIDQKLNTINIVNEVFDERFFSPEHEAFIRKLIEEYIPLNRRRKK